MNNFCLKEFDYLPNKEQQEFLNFLMSNEFPLFYNRQTSEKYMYYSHALMQRNKNDLPEGGIINSPYYDYAKNFFLEVCSKNNIEVNLHYIPVHRHPYYENLGFKKNDFPVAEKFHQEAISIPMYATLKDEDREYIIKTLRKKIMVI